MSTTIAPTTRPERLAAMSLRNMAGLGEQKPLVVNAYAGDKVMLARYDADGNGTVEAKEIAARLARVPAADLAKIDRSALVRRVLATVTLAGPVAAIGAYFITAGFIPNGIAALALAGLTAAAIMRISAMTEIILPRADKALLGK